MQPTLYPGGVPLPGNGLADRRSSPRLPQQTRVLITADGWKDPLGGWVVDRSLGGLRLQVAEPLEAGTVLKVRPAWAPAKYGILVQVKYCREDGGHWYAGCEFVGASPLNVAQLFG